MLCLPATSDPLLRPRADEILLLPAIAMGVAGITAADAAATEALTDAGEVTLTAPSAACDLAWRTVGVLAALSSLSTPCCAALECTIGVLPGLDLELLGVGVCCEGVPASLLEAACLPDEPFLAKDPPWPA